MDLGEQMHALCQRLFPICRSITGDGFRQSLDILKEYLPDLRTYEVSTGTQCFDWTVPKEWNIKDAYIVCPDGKKICQFKDSNLHVLNYSTPIDAVVSLDELEKHLYSLPEQPNAIPYITSYYKERWGFCITDEQRQTLKQGNYRVFIDSTLENGALTYGELILPGDSEKEIFISSYLCHPSMANNELSGPVVATFLANYLRTLPNRRYTYRFVIVPETIGSITYLSRHLSHLKKHVVAGFNLSCIGDDRNYSYLESRYADTLADRVAQYVIKTKHPDYCHYSFLERGSDERQYCAPGVDLPVCAVMRTKYGDFPEYHTSLDDLSLVTPAGLFGGYELIRDITIALEKNVTYEVSVFCEPQLGKRGLYPTLSQKNSEQSVRDMLNVISYCDGKNDLIQVADYVNINFDDAVSITSVLHKNNVLHLSS